MTLALFSGDTQPSAELIGTERLPLLICDQFVVPQNALERHIPDQADFLPDKKDLYPGRRAAASDAVKSALMAAINQTILPEMGRTMGFESVKRQVFLKNCLFSYACQSPESLLPIQRIPHFDTIESGYWAMVLYLFKDELGGTGFFRHRRTGYETISDDRSKRYFRVLDDQARSGGLPAAQYLRGSGELFEMHASVAPQFGRAILYPANALHSGLIPDAAWQDPNTKRLTLNALFHVQ